MEVERAYLGSLVYFCICLILYFCDDIVFPRSQPCPDRRKREPTRNLLCPVLNRSSSYLFTCCVYDHLLERLPYDSQPFSAGNMIFVIIIIIIMIIIIVVIMMMSIRVDSRVQELKVHLCVTCRIVTLAPSPFLFNTPVVVVGGDDDCEG